MSNETTNGSPAIELENLSAGYSPGKLILENVSFSVPKSQILAVIGGSGCGKSTLLKHMIGLRPVLDGDVRFDGKSIVKANREQKQQILKNNGVAFQGGALFRALSLFENVALPMRELGTWSKSEIADRVREKLSLVNLNGYEKYMPADLSGGMVKRAAFARAMALDPAFLFFDEPSAGLDPISSASLDRLMLSIREKTGATILIVTHELPSIFAIADRVVILSRETRGIIGDGNPRELAKTATDPFIHAFLNRETPDV